VPPASESGEELRDVILWLITLDHAKSTSRPTAFVTADAGFWEADKPKSQILQDIDSAKVDIRLYKDLAEFTRDNALVSEPVTYPWIDEHLSGATLEEMIAGPLRDSIKASRRVTGDIQKVTSTQIRFVDGSIYKIDARTDFAELRYRGFFVVETVSVRYDFSQFEGLPSAQGFGSLRSLTSPGASPLVPLATLLGGPHGQRGETYRNTYEVEAEIHLSCRVEASNTEIEVDEVKPEKIALRR
jgi:hypothetical protein